MDRNYYINRSTDWWLIVIDRTDGYVIEQLLSNRLCPPCASDRPISTLSTSFIPPFILCDHGQLSQIEATGSEETIKK